MREEVMMILKMLEDGKITSEQAALLIEAVDEVVGLRPPEESLQSPGNDSDKSEQSMSPVSSEQHNIPDMTGLAERLAGLGDMVDRAALENFAERIRDTVESAVKSTDRAIGRMQQQVRDRRRSAEPDKEEVSASQWSKAIIEPFLRMFSPGIKVEKVVTGYFPGDSGKKIDVELSTWNGSIVVNPWDGSGFRVNVTANVMSAGEEQESQGEAAKALLEELLECHVTDDSLKIKINHEKAVSGAFLDVKLPRQFLYDMNLVTQNGRVSLGDFECRVIRVETSNGRIELDNTCGVIAELETSNGRINVSGIAQRLSAGTSNGGITVIPRKIMGECRYELKTSNGGIDVQLAGADKVGYHIDAKTRHGRIALDLPDLVYQVKDEGSVRREIITETSGFSENTDRLLIRARTSNGQVRIANR